MKNLLVIFALAGILLLAAFDRNLRRYHYRYQTSESVELATLQSKWGTEPFDAVLFRWGTLRARRVMVADLISSRRYIGKDIREVFRDLGNGDMHSPSDWQLPRYRLNLLAESPKGAQYVLLFSEDEATHRVTRVNVYRECCDGVYTTYGHYRGIIQLDDAFPGDR